MLNLNCGKLLKLFVKICLILLDGYNINFCSEYLLIFTLLFDGIIMKWR